MICFPISGQGGHHGRKNTDQDKSCFERNINSISSLLIRFMVVMVPVIFIANFITKGSWLDSLMFGITIAVGLMPEMLPVIMTSSLAKVAVTRHGKSSSCNPAFP